MLNSKEVTDERDIRNEEMRSRCKCDMSDMSDMSESQSIELHFREPR
jgi:hypothetical protein